MKASLKRAFVDTLPVMTGYIVLGFGFGIILKSGGHSMLLALCMSLFIYAGSMQYAAIGLMTGGASMISVFLTTLAVNARHIFYGISMLDKYRGVGKRKPYLIFSLTDETYSLVCRDSLGVPEEKRGDYYLLVSVINHLWWITGTLLGAGVGSLVSFNTEGIDFALTALFLTVFIEGFITAKSKLPALIGVGASVLFLLILGQDNFLIPAMLLIALLLCVIPEAGDDSDKSRCDSESTDGNNEKTDTALVDKAPEGADEGQVTDGE